MELDLEQLRGAGRKAIAISWTSIVMPFGFAVPLALWLHPRLGAETGRLSFVMFMGAAMAITAFPVLARILRDRDLTRTRLGALTITCAAVDDVTAWCMLAAAAAVAGSGDGLDVLRIVALTIAFGLVVVLAVAPVLRRLRTVSAPVAVGLALVGAFVTDRIGVHAIFGAFMAGVAIPRRPEILERLESRLGTVAESILLPVFFVTVGLATRVDLMDSGYLWGVAALVLLVAVVGKFGGSAVAARVLGEPWSDAAVIGTLMNTRGLTEIVILTMGLQLGVIGPELFTIMVLMALATTLMAGPLLDVIAARRLRAAGVTDVGLAGPAQANG
jgi:Kef-type K+ transport system membrane component KefB